MNDEDYIPSNRQRAKTATNKERFWCKNCDLYYLGELGKCDVCGAKGDHKKIKYDRNRSSFNV